MKGFDTLIQREVSPYRTVEYQKEPGKHWAVPGLISQ